MFSHVVVLKSRSHKHMITNGQISRHAFISWKNRENIVIRKANIIRTNEENVAIHYTGELFLLELPLPQKVVSNVGDAKFLPPQSIFSRINIMMRAEMNDLVQQVSKQYQQRILIFVYVPGARN